jgi:hypothetical protein
MLCLPRLYDALLDAVPGDHLGPLKTVIVAGEDAHWGLVKRHRQTLSTARLFNE